MAKLRANHRSQQKGVFSGYLRILIVLAFTVALLLFSKSTLTSFLQRIYGTINIEESEDSAEIYYLPSPGEDSVYRYKGFHLAYNEDYEQASWVAYELTVNHLNAPKVGRSDYFMEDIRIESGSATFYDYKNSGYTKGHLVPAADRAYSIETMEETFLMSNMSPQIYECNSGIWRELEEQTRDWARENRGVYIVTGPIISSQSPKRIGKNQVAVPDSFFKIVLDYTEPELKMIGFVIPNSRSDQPLLDYATSIDKIEEKTGHDFFSVLFTDKLEDSLESSIDLEKWTFNEKRYQTRITKWNNR